MKPVVRVVIVEVGVGKAVVDLHIGVGVLFQQDGCTTFFGRPVIGFVANREAYCASTKTNATLNRKFLRTESSYAAPDV